MDRNNSELSKASQEAAAGQYFQGLTWDQSKLEQSEAVEMLQHLADALEADWKWLVRQLGDRLEACAKPTPSLHDPHPSKREVSHPACHRNDQSSGTTKAVGSSEATQH